MAKYLLSFGSLPEPHADPPSLEGYHHDLLDKMDENERELLKASNTLGAWEDFIGELATLDTPEIVLAAIEKAKPVLENWLRTHVSALQVAGEELVEEEFNIGQPWK